MWLKLNAFHHKERMEHKEERTSRRSSSMVLDDLNNFGLGAVGSARGKRPMPPRGA
jgi:hypothetical protein